MAGGTSLILLDTCTLLWLAADQQKLSDVAKEAIAGNAGNMQKGERRDWVHISSRLSDANKIKALGWSPKTGLEKGLEKTFEWFDKNVK